MRYDEVDALYHGHLKEEVETEVPGCLFEKQDTVCLFRMEERVEKSQFSVKMAVFCLGLAALVVSMVVLFSAVILADGIEKGSMAIIDSMSDQNGSGHSDGKADSGP